MSLASGSLASDALLEECPVTVFGQDNLAPVLFVCDHASAFMPARYHGLGLGADDIIDHIAWDPGALPVARALAAQMEACLVGAGASRLLIDVNRDLSAPDLMRAESDGRAVPGNVSISTQERASRIAALYDPFHHGVSEQIERHLAAAIRPLVVSVHSFTPLYQGQRRQVEIGLLHDGPNEGFARQMMQALAPSGYDVQLNQPYGPQDGVLYTLEHHATARGLPSLMLEIRNDLIGDEAGQMLLAEIIHKALAPIAHKAQSDTLFSTSG